MKRIFRENFPSFKYQVFFMKPGFYTKIMIISKDSKSLFWKIIFKQPQKCEIMCMLCKNLLKISFNKINKIH